MYVYILKIYILNTYIYQNIHTYTHTCYHALVARDPQLIPYRILRERGSVLDKAHRKPTIIHNLFDVFLYYKENKIKDISYFFEKKFDLNIR